MQNKIQTNCFAYAAGRCAVLKEIACATGMCKFYKTAAQLEEDRQRTLQRCVA